MQVSILNDDYEAANAKNSGLTGKSGQINVKIGSRAEMEFSFLDSKSESPVELPAFYISIFDLAKPKGPTEKVTVNGYDDIIFPEKTEYQVEDAMDGGKLVTAL